MANDAPKTAYELAMERLRRQDVEQGVEERAVTDEQKAQIAEARRVHASKVAEVEILHKSTLRGLLEPEARQKVDEDHRRDLQRLHDDLERKLVKIRG